MKRVFLEYKIENIFHNLQVLLFNELHKIEDINFINSLKNQQFFTINFN